MTWDTAVPADADFVSLGAGVIRTLKTDLQTSLRGDATEGDEAVFPGADDANPVFRYRGLKGTTGARPAATDYGLYINTTLNTLQRSNGSSWDDVATLIPATTKMVFFQATVPTGWTQDTTHDGKVLRVESGTGGGSAGSADPATAITLAHSHTVDGHTHSISSDGNHTHTVDSHTHTMSAHTHSTPNHQHTLDHTTATRTLTGNFLASAVGAGEEMKLTNGGGGSLWRLLNRTENSGSSTSGANSDATSGTAPGTDTQGAHTHTGATGSTGPGTNSQLTSITLATIDVIIGTKD